MAPPTAFLFSLMLVFIQATVRAKGDPAPPRGAVGQGPEGGSDGVTYPSECALDNAAAAAFRKGLHVVHAGPCRCISGCQNCCGWDLDGWRRCTEAWASAVDSRARCSDCDDEDPEYLECLADCLGHLAKRACGCRCFLREGAHWASLSASNTQGEDASVHFTAFAKDDDCIQPVDCQMHHMQNAWECADRQDLHCVSREMDAVCRCERDAPHATETPAPVPRCCGSDLPAWQSCIDECFKERQECSFDQCPRTWYTLDCENLCASTYVSCGCGCKRFLMGASAGAGGLPHSTFALRAAAGNPVVTGEDSDTDLDNPVVCYAKMINHIKTCHNDTFCLTLATDTLCACGQALPTKILPTVSTTPMAPLTTLPPSTETAPPSTTETLPSTTETLPSTKAPLPPFLEIEYPTRAQMCALPCTRNIKRCEKLFDCSILPNKELHCRTACHNYYLVDLAKCVCRCKGFVDELLHLMSAASMDAPQWVNVLGSIKPLLAAVGGAFNVTASTPTTNGVGCLRQADQTDAACREDCSPKDSQCKVRCAAFLLEDYCACVHRGKDDPGVLPSAAGRCFGEEGVLAIRVLAVIASIALTLSRWVRSVLICCSVRN